MHSLVIVR